ncbi:CDP-glucose 4,6-dehydratase [Pseudohoeflea coraliihabitans]|uniref:CDP-glucose 4,6-dehydratase n=1 Tax=Pseudohoeflea coraliihabitans TaxID=2860393 RepID=A0ABS6WNI4_9HYPH|nr:CDP-glucose 4,6-dehydratase [Pseudohoeflea sp. DP4N28-3]MBW3097511.1 CDP-glucose 4,6-dehydratase [Pseudohoeflea sp. DP4N28-3]
MTGTGSVRPDPAFWSGRRVLLTGHTGFKGSWLLDWLLFMGAKVTGLALPPEAPDALYSNLFAKRPGSGEFIDLRDRAAVHAQVMAARPEIVFHLAAQSLVRRGHADPAATMAINVGGTLHLLEALAAIAVPGNGPRAIVVTTTDKVYANDGGGHRFVETDPLGGTDPYSASKAACEMLVDGWRPALARAGCAIATARAGNVIGGGDWAEDRLIPDAVRAWRQGAALKVRRPEATRPWQHVLEPLRGYLILAERLAGHGPKAVESQPSTAYNFGPSDAPASVRAVLHRAQQHFPVSDVEFASTPNGPNEAATLALDASKAGRELGVAPVWNLLETIDRTMAWYRAHADGADAARLCADDRDAFLKTLQDCPAEVA